MTRLSEIIFCLTTFIVLANGKVFSECNGKPYGSYIRGQNGCRSYIYCGGEKSYESSCPPGLFFDALTGICDDPANVDCIDGPEAPPMPVCPATSSNEIIYLASAESCAEYYMCRDGVPKAMHCVTNLHFNALTQQCDTPEMANCKIVTPDQPATVGTLKPIAEDPPTPGTVTRTTTTITYFTSTTPRQPTALSTQTPTSTVNLSSTPPGPPTVTPSTTTGTPVPTTKPYSSPPPTWSPTTTGTPVPTTKPNSSPPPTWSPTTTGTPVPTTKPNSSPPPTWSPTTTGTPVPTTKPNSSPPPTWPPTTTGTPVPTTKPNSSPPPTWSPTTTGTPVPTTKPNSSPPPTWPSSTTLPTTTPPTWPSTTTVTLTTTTPYFPSTTVTTIRPTGTTPVWTTSVTSSTISPKELCKQVYAGYFAYPDDCHFYYRCAGGELTKHECPYGFGWNVDLKVCTAAGCST